MPMKHLDRTRQISPVSNASKSSNLKSILVHLQVDESVDERLEVALSLARAASAHLSCVHVTPIQAYVAFDSFGGVFVMDDVMKSIDEQAAQLGARIEAKLGSEDVSWDFEEVTADVPSSIISRAALSDLVVVGREPHRQDFVGPAVQLLGDLLQRCRTPLFVPAEGAAAIDPAGTAAIAWDGSYEAANAVRSALGLLKLAERVIIIQVAEEKPQSFPGTKMLEYLSRHDIHAELTEQPAPSGFGDQQMIAATLVNHALLVNAAYLVMGAYSRSRISEYVFGGVTRTLLKQCPLSLVLAH